MKNKTIFFSNFKHNPTNKVDSENSLIIDEINNAKNTNGFIESNCAYKNTIDYLFDTNTSNIINKNNSSLLNKCKQIIPYYFKTESGEDKLRYFAICNNDLYELNLGTCFFELVYHFLTFPKILSNKNNIYLFDKNNKCVIISENNSLQIENIPTLKSFTVFNNILYFTTNENPFKIYFTEECSLKDLSSNVEQYSSIEVGFNDGKILSVFYLKNYLYVITQYAIYRFDEETQGISKLFKFNQIILNNTIQLINDEVYFYSQNGLFLFNGASLNHLCSNHINLHKNANSFCFNQNYYIFSLDFPNLLYCFNFENNFFEVTKLQSNDNIYIIQNPLIYSLNIACIFNNNYNNISFTETANNFLNQKIKFKTTTFSSSKDKQINNLFIKAEGTFNLSITSDHSNKTLFIANNTKFYNLAIPGTYFDFEITSDNYFKLSSIILTFSEAGD